MSVSIVDGAIQIQGTVSGTDITPVSLHGPTHAIRIFVENPPVPNIIVGDVFANALIGTDGIAISSGISTTVIVGFRSEFVNTSGFLQNQISNLDAVYATDASVASVSGFIQNQISAINIDEVGPAIVAGSNIIVTSGSNVITISSAVSDGKALIGSDGVTVTSGTNSIGIAGFRSEFISTSGHLQSQISSIDSDEIAPAIIAGTANVTIISGSNTTSISVSAPPDLAITGSDGIIVTSGVSSVNVAGFRSEFISASGSLQTQITSNTNAIANLDATYATDAQLLSMGLS